MTLRWYCLLYGIHGNQSDAKWPLPPKCPFLLDKTYSHMFAYDRSILSHVACKSMFIASMNILEMVWTLFVLKYNSLKSIYCKIFVEKRQIALHIDGHQHAFLNCLQSYHCHWYFSLCCIDHLIGLCLLNSGCCVCFQLPMPRTLVFVDIDH